MTHQQIKAGKIYKNKKNKYQYDILLCVTEVSCNEKRLNDSYVEYCWVRKPDMIQYTNMLSAIEDWELVDEGEL